MKAKKRTKNASTDNLNELIVSIIQDKKGKDIVSLDLRKIPEAIADYFVICHGESTTQTRAITDHLEEEVRNQANIKPFHIEGRSNGEWCLLDFGDVVVHIFQREKREFYQLEDLWSDAVIQHYKD
ncbi:MAG: ribosome silencing factor [Sphingobacteriales bacterium]|nr:ribosome silencing factor [Sphingobacteriales bacterium]